MKKSFESKLYWALKINQKLAKEGVTNELEENFGRRLQRKEVSD